MTRAEERLILSGAARLGDSWPQPRPRRRAAELDRARRSCRASPRSTPMSRSATTGSSATVLNSPASDVLRLEAPVPVAPGEQLALAFNGGAPAHGAGGVPAAARARAPPPRRPRP